MASAKPALDDAKLQTICKAAFDEMDADKSGSVDVKELEHALKSMAQKNGLPVPNKQDVQDALKLYDKNKDGKIQFQEFLEITKESLQRARGGASSERKGKDAKIILEEKAYLLFLSASFDVFDHSRDGFIESKELTKSLELFGTEAKIAAPKKEIVQKLIEKYDGNKDRKIDYQEFGKMVSELYKIEVLPGKGTHATDEDDDEELKDLELNSGSAYAEIDEAAKERIKLGDEYIKYIEETGLAMAFKIIFAEILSKKIPEDAAFAYTATRLRQIGEDIAYIQNSKYKKAPVKH